MAKNLQKPSDVVAEEKKRSKKSYILEYSLSFLILLAIAIAAGCVDVYSRGVSWETRCPVVIADSFAISGTLCLCFWLLVYFSSEGAFDIIVYGCRKLWDVTFHSKKHVSSLPDTYYDYVALRRAKKHKRFFGFLFISIAFFAIGLILSLVYMTR